MPEGAVRATCNYCSASLVVEATRVSAHRPPAQREAEEELPPLEEPDASLTNLVGPRFELSMMEQVVPGAVDDVFTHLLLPDARFAFVAMRVVDEKQQALSYELNGAFAVLKASLESDQDPGLAANLALEELSKKGFPHRLEVVVLLFDPSRMKVTPYAAASDSGAMWMSGEEGRPITIDTHRHLLEKKFLREQGSHFENGRPLHLAAHDVVVLPSAAVLNRGGKYSGNFPHDYWETAREHLGEEPLRVVTLLKNTFWKELQKRRKEQAKPVGHVRIAAVRAVLPPLREALPKERSVKLLSTPAFDLAALLAPADQLTLLPLHGNRQVLVLISGAKVEDAAAQGALEAIRAVLDRPDHGDNDNPRLAGRNALAKLPPGTALTVVQTLDQYGRVKYFRAGFAQPVALGPRGVRDSDVMAFDEGGEATVREGARLFFLGDLPVEGPCNNAGQLAEQWPGGKASRLYDALVDHWKTKKSDKALEKLVLAAVSDCGAEAPRGMLVVTGKKG